MARPRLLVVSCGGTISSVAADGDGAAPRLDADALVAAVPELAQLAAVRTHAFTTAPSSHGRLSEVLRLHAFIDQQVRCGEPLDAVVVTHGTDTLEEVAFALDLLWAHDLPLVVTGAMRHPGMPGADGAANLLAAAVTATSAQSRGLGVLVVLNDVVHAARLVRKMHTASVATFASPTVGPLGFVTEGSAQIVLVPRERRPLAQAPATVRDDAVALIAGGLGDGGRLVAAVREAGYQGAVVESLGGGHAPLGMTGPGGLADLAARMPVVLASRTGAGPLLRTTYDFAGSEIDLLGAGLIGAGVLDGPKSRVLLTLLLGAHADRPAIEAAFAQHGCYPSRRP